MKIPKERFVAWDVLKEHLPALLNGLESVTEERLDRLVEFIEEELILRKAAQIRLKNGTANDKDVSDALLKGYIKAWGEAAAFAGHPDAAEACRNICRRAKEIVSATDPARMVMR